MAAMEDFSREGRSIPFEHQGRRQQEQRQRGTAGDVPIYIYEQVELRLFSLRCHPGAEGASGQERLQFLPHLPTPSHTNWAKCCCP